MGNMGGSFGQAFAQTLMQGHQIINAVADRKEELTLRKKLVSAQLQEHETKTALATRKLSAMAELSNLTQPREWEGSELGPGGVSEAPAIPEHTRLRLAMGLDPDAAAKELVRVREPKVDLDALYEKLTGAPSAAAPRPAATAGEAPVAEAPVPSGPRPIPGPPATPPAAQGPKLDREVTWSIGDDGKRRLSIKTGNINYDIKHVTLKGADGRAQIFRVATNPKDPNDVTSVPVGPAAPPEEFQKWASAVDSLGLKPGSDEHEAAVTDFLLIDKTMQGPARDVLMTQTANYYRAMATARPTSATAPAKPTAEGARAQAKAEEVEQATKKAAAEASVKTAGQQDAPIGENAIRYISRTNLQHPDPSRRTKDVEGDRNLVQISAQVAAKLPQVLTTKASLDRLEEIVLSSPEYFPPQSGDRNKDVGLVVAARGKFKFRSKTDPVVGEIESLKVTMPGTIKLFGDSGNISEAERAMAESALGLEPSTREQALARIDAIRSMVSNTIEPMGLPPIPRKPGPKPVVKPEKGEPMFDWDDGKRGRRLIPVRP